MKKVLSLILATLMIATCFAVIPVSAAAAGWDGTTATAPSGTGTEADPYIIESAANLLWMSKQIGDGTVDLTKTSNPFAGKFFKQTKDIDLNGKTLPSIGYLYVNGPVEGNYDGSPSGYKQEDGTYKDKDGKAMDSSGRLLDIAGNLAEYKAAYVFGGTYDGQDFKISNGTVQEPTGTHPHDHIYGSGLFGAIYGATIKNVKLDGITATGGSVVGTLVGIAAADGYAKTADGKIPTDLVDPKFNQILDCSTSATCSVQATNVCTSSAYDNAGRVGGIVGLAQAVTIRNCVNNGKINVLGNINFGGGIAGTASLNTVINKCVNTGMITYDCSTNPNKAESGFGGIVGVIGQGNAGFTNTSLKYGGGVSITHCYNTGSFTFVGTKNTGATYWGGILGGANSLHPGYTFLISDCFNLCGTLNGLTADTNFRIAGLVGSYWIGAGADVSTLTITDSYSVNVESKREVSSYVCFNEYICKGRATKAGEPDVTAPELEDGTLLVDTRTAAEIAPWVAKIDAAIAKKAVDSPEIPSRPGEVDVTEADTTTEEPTTVNDEVTSADDETTKKDDETTKKDDVTTAGGTTDKGDDTAAAGCASVAGGIVVGIMAIAAIPAFCFRKKED